MNNAFIDSNIIEELIKKIASLEDDFAEILEKPARVDIRIKQLSIAKIIVNIYNKNQFILIKAYYDLAAAYLDQDYFEQAKEHLQTALSLNSQFVDNLANQELQIKINVSLSRFLFNKVLSSLQTNPSLIRNCGKVFKTK